MVDTSGLESTASSLENWTRAGYVARGLVYILLGYVAISSPPPDSTSALFKEVQNLPAGNVLLFIIMIGAFGYALWKIFDAVKNLEGFDDDFTGHAKRFFYVVGGFGYLVFVYLAAKTLFGSGGSGDGTQTAAQMAPGWLVLATGLGIGIAGAYQIKKGITREFLRGLAGNTPPFVEWFGLVGHVARGIVFMVCGWFVVQASQGDSSEATGLAGALRSLHDTGWIFTALCIGLILFGLFSFVEARYRVIPNEDLRPNR